MCEPRWICQQALVSDLVKRRSEQVDNQSHRRLRSSTTVVPVIHFDNVHTNQVALCTQTRQKIVELEETQPSLLFNLRTLSIASKSLASPRMPI